MTLVELEQAELRDHTKLKGEHGFRPNALGVFNVLPSIGEFYLDEDTGILKVTAVGSRFNSEIGIIEITDRSKDIFARLKDIFEGIRLVTQTDGDVLQPPQFRPAESRELVAA